MSFLAHIFFDDAFESRQDSNGIYKVNSYVKQLIASVETAARYLFTFISYNIGIRFIIIC